MFLAIDVGGTSIKYGLIEEKDTGPQIIYHSHLLSHSTRDTKKIFSQIFEDIKGKGEVKEVGLCAPDLNPFTGILMSPPNLDWEDMNLKKVLADFFSGPTYFLNDADAFLLSEILFGEAKDKKNVLAVTLGTGVGTSVLSSARLVLGGNHLGVEGGHILIPWGKRKCVCGIEGHLEAYLSNRGICQTYEEMGGEKIKKASDLLLKVKKGEVAAKKTMEVISEQLSQGLADLYNIFSPEAIMFGGGNSILLPLIKEDLNDRLLSKIFAPLKAKLQISKTKKEAIDSSLYSAYSTKWGDRHLLVSPDVI